MKNKRIVKRTLVVLMMVLMSVSAVGCGKEVGSVESLNKTIEKLGDVIEYVEVDESNTALAAEKCDDLMHSVLDIDTDTEQAEKLVELFADYFKKNRDFYLDHSVNKWGKSEEWDEHLHKLRDEAYDSVKAIVNETKKLNKSYPDNDYWEKIKSIEKITGLEKGDRIWE